MGQIKHYNNGKWTIYTSGEGLSGYTGVTNTYYVGPDLDNDGNLSKANPDGSLVNLEKPNVGFTGFTYEIGEYVSTEGGVIYHRYLSGDTQYYLVVDTEDLGDYFIPFPYYIVWSNIDNVASGAISLWDGQNNTDEIVNQVGCNSGAAYECSISNRGSKSDWYLPSSGEFIKMWSNIFEVSKGIEDASGTQMLLNYWTSTERDSSDVYYFDTISGYSSLTNKAYNNRVRMVRKFSI